MPGDRRQEPSSSPGRLTASDERRRIARDLHDSSSQLLIVLQSKLDQLKHLDHPEAPPIVDECERVLEEIRVQIKALEHATH